MPKCSQCDRWAPSRFEACPDCGGQLVQTQAGSATPRTRSDDADDILERALWAEMKLVEAIRRYQTDEPGILDMYQAERDHFIQRLRTEFDRETYFDVLGLVEERWKKKRAPGLPHAIFATNAAALDMIRILRAEGPVAPEEHEPLSWRKPRTI